VEEFSEFVLFAPRVSCNETRSSDTPGQVAIFEFFVQRKHPMRGVPSCEVTLLGKGVVRVVNASGVEEECDWGELTAKAMSSRVGSHM
jgi:hypothetical protein